MSICIQCAHELQPGWKACPMCATPIAGAGALDTPPVIPGIAIAGLVLSFVPIFFMNIVGGVLGIVALNKISAEPRRYSGRAVAIASIVVGFGWMAIAVIGILAAIAIPNFLKFQSRARQSEAKVHLAQIARAQHQFTAAEDRPATSFQDLDWRPQANHLYTYCLNTDCVPGADGVLFSTQEIQAETGATVLAVGNIDGDDTLDIWTLDGSGQPQNIVDDLGN